MNKKIVQKIKDVSIVTRIILLFLIISIATYTVNLFMYWNINKSLKTIEYVYVSNAKLNDLTNNLDKVQSYMHEYLNTSSSNALASYYTNFQDYSNLVNDLNDDITDNESILMERKIRNMSLEYLEIADITIQAKRGRNIERYKKHFAEASELYEFINANMYSLNNQQFKHNSDNYYALLEALKYLEAINMIILIVIGIISLLLIVIITNSITEPLKKLASQANEVATGNFDVTFDDSFANDEVGVVSKAFKKMVINIQKYIKQIKESIEHEAKLKENELLMKNLLKDAQLKYLQAQINPHFLYNTLNAGVQLATIEEAEKTGLFIEKTAEFFRYNINQMNKDTTIKEEIELVDNYIYIMSIRLFKNINFKKNIDDELLLVTVPSMILQPLVENALSYGIRDIDWEGEIVLSIYKDHDNICIKVVDNGKGMQEETVYEIMNGQLKEADLKRSSNGIGLKNVISRLRLYFEREDVLEIYSEGEGRGTEIRITIPKQDS